MESFENPSKKINIMAVYNQMHPNQMNPQANKINAHADKDNKNLKRAGMVAGGVGLAGAGAAFAATQINDADVDAEDLELTPDDLIAGANSGAVEDSAEDAKADAHADKVELHENHVSYHESHDLHVHHHNAPYPQMGHEQAHVGDPHVEVTESAVIFDEEGNVVSVFDSGTIDGKDFMVIDSDLNGKGDILAVDENRNGIFEDNEIRQIDNQTYEIGQGDHLSAYARVGEELYKIEDFDDSGLRGHNYAQNDHIENDFHDGGSSEHDFAFNNEDYNNHGGEQYNAGVELEVESFDAHDSFADNSLDVTPDYGYADNGYADAGVDTYADASVDSYDAGMDSYSDASADYGYTDTSVDSSSDIASFDSVDTFDA